MRKEDLTQKQIDMLEGYICPYCKEKAEQVNGEKALKRGDLKEIMYCKFCHAWSPIVDGEPEGRICTQDERKSRDIVEEELKRLIKGEGDEEELREALAHFIGCPVEYADARHAGVKSLPKILQFCMINDNISGAKLRWRKPGDACNEERTEFMVDSSACHGCPHFILKDEQYVWCDVDFIYGKFRPGKSIYA